jgi:hypothetical protein
MEHNIEFYARFFNNTNITFSKTETSPLGKSLKYNLHHNDKQWISRLALEADTAVSLVDPLQQNLLKHPIAKHTKIVTEIHPTQL